MTRKAKKATETATETTAPSAKLATTAQSLVETPLAFTANRKELVAVIRKLAAICPKGKRTMPLLANVLIKATATGVALTTTDLEVWGTHKAPAFHVHGEGSVCVNAKGLLDVLSKLDSADVTIRTSTIAALVVEITSGTATVSLQAMHARDYPRLPAVMDEDPVLALTAVDATTLRELIEATEHAVCQDSTRFHLNGILFQYDGTTARMVATDGHRLALAQRELTRAGDFKTPGDGLILPSGVTDAIRKSLASHKGLGTCEIGFVKHAHTNMLVVRRNGYTLVCKPIDAQFPPYEQVIPKDNRRLITVERRTLLDTLRRTLPLCSSTKGALLATSVNAGTWALKVTAEHPDRGGIAESLGADCRPDGATMTIGVNPRYLIEALESVGGHQVTLAISDDDEPMKHYDGAPAYRLNPILVRCTADAAQHSIKESPRLVVIMPMRM